MCLIIRNTKAQKNLYRQGDTHMQNTEQLMTMWKMIRSDFLLNLQKVIPGAINELTNHVLVIQDEDHVGTWLFLDENYNLIVKFDVFAVSSQSFANMWQNETIQKELMSWHLALRTNKIKKLSIDDVKEIWNHLETK